ncbi:MAG: formylglycine-generating enzyme family protein [Opitutaceae bacterium]|nr:formylglycine-generating enzyme family protein [Opitutaceae bacterium]
MNTHKMNTHNTTQNTALLLATLLITAGAATAIAATPGSSIIDMPMVAVGDAGNAADPRTNNLYGAVNYDYYIGTYMVTNTQYAAFLNAVAATDTYSLYNTAMGDSESAAWGGITRSGESGEYTYAVKEGWGQKPVNYVSFYDAARFVNWLGTGNTETGVYNLTVEGSILRDTTAWANGGYAIASEDEWYKAAYYNGDGTYREYPVTGSVNQGTTNYKNTENYAITDNTPSGETHIADVDHYDMVSGANSFYGTYQQGGNLYEWSDTPSPDAKRAARGGAYSVIYTFFSSTYRNPYPEEGEDMTLGFRVVFRLAAVPEPGTVAGVTGLAALVVGIWARRGRGIPWSS